jgi:hypothetical protein
VSELVRDGRLQKVIGRLVILFRPKSIEGERKRPQTPLTAIRVHDLANLVGANMRGHKGGLRSHEVELDVPLEVVIALDAYFLLVSNALLNPCYLQPSSVLICPRERRDR